METSKSKWLLTTTLAAVIAFSSLSLIASADDGTTSTDADRPLQLHMEEMQTAIESGDYNAFAEVAPDDLLEVINADNFNRFVEMHNHLQAAKDIADELGLPQKGGMKGKMQKFQNGEMMQNREEIRAAVEAGDYQTWYELNTQNGRDPMILDYVNEDNFATFAELHQAIQDQDFETAETLKAELGLPDRPVEDGEPVGMGKGRGFMKNMNE